MKTKIKLFRVLFEFVPLPVFLTIVFVLLLWILAVWVNKLQISDKRKSLIISSYSFSALLIILFFIRFWPPSDAELALLAGQKRIKNKIINKAENE